MVPQIFSRVHDWLSGESDTRVLPERIRKIIQDQQDQSEILIGWIQFGILLTFTILYAISPTTNTIDSRFQPVPWVLTIYFIFVVTRLFLAYRRRLPFWFLVLSVIVDMGLLLGLIWSFHVQYLQPAAFYLKAPTILYIFIFIALRSLRFDPGFVVLSGVVAASGWFMLAVYAIWESGFEQTITRNYVTYMTSNSVLLGAEFDKILSILMVTLILTVAIARARKRLINAVSKEETARGLSRFVPEDVVTQISTSEHSVQVGQSEIGDATILFIDIEAFTTIGESLKPKQLIDTLNEYFAIVAIPIQKNHGEICQFQGDAILASFNLPKAHADHAGNAIRAAIQIQNLLASYQFSIGTRLNVRIGINSGSVVGGFVGTPDRLGYTIHGDAVNLASRLEQLNKQYKTRILVSDSTRALAENEELEFTYVDRHSGRGRQSAINIFSVEQKN